MRPQLLRGIEATRRIKEASAHTQVIVLTSDQTLRSKMSAAEAGAYAYLVKDWGAGVVVDTVVDAWRHQCGLDRPQSVEAASSP